jgi:hypothetical protein
MNLMSIAALSSAALPMSWFRFELNKCAVVIGFDYLWERKGTA